LRNQTAHKRQQVLLSKPASTTEKIVVTLDGKGFVPLRRSVRQIQGCFDQHPYFQGVLGKTNGVTLKNLAAVDPGKKLRPIHARMPLRGENAMKPIKLPRKSATSSFLSAWSRSWCWRGWASPDQVPVRTLKRLSAKKTEAEQKFVHMQEQIKRADQIEAQLADARTTSLIWKRHGIR